MINYNKSIGSLNYCTDNAPGTAVTRVYIENLPGSYDFDPLEEEWIEHEPYLGAPELPEEQLTALETALVAQGQRRLEAFRAGKKWSKYISRLISDEKNVLEVCTIYKGSYSPDGDMRLKEGLRGGQCEGGGIYASYLVPYGPDKVKEVKRWLRDADLCSAEAIQLRDEMTRELETVRMKQADIERSRNEI